jgi:N-acetylglucosamine-6-phosphate deacetylase
MTEAKVFKGNLILEDQVLENATITCENGRIVAIDERGASVPGMMDYTNRYISPGFIGIHVHGGAGADYMDGSPDAVRAINRAHAQHGTTSIFPTTTTGSFSQLERMIKLRGGAAKMVYTGWFEDRGRPFC